MVVVILCEYGLLIVSVTSAIYICSQKINPAGTRFLLAGLLKGVG